MSEPGYFLGEGTGYRGIDDEGKSQDWKVGRFDGVNQSFPGDISFPIETYDGNGDSGMHAVALLK